MKPGDVYLRSGGRFEMSWESNGLSVVSRRVPPAVLWYVVRE